MKIIAYVIVFRPLYVDQQMYYIDHILDKYFVCLHYIHRPIITVAVCEDTQEMRYYNTFCSSAYGSTCAHDIVEVCEIQYVNQMIAMCFGENDHYV
uniref:Uncharacterized protein n=1 Tax=Erinnyis ello granulovirus TaxID=307444 RepID=A0A288WJ09_9BBAC|nr:hypothetical protein EREL_064 [Erinnyis ello granulovirus]